MSPLTVILSLTLSLAAIEGFSCWWMHPAPASLGESVLIYRPSFSSPSTSPRPSSNQQSTIDNQQSTISPTSLSTLNSRLSASSLTSLPEIYAKSAPMLRCTGGEVNFAKLSDTSGIHLAFFEWDGTDTGSVFEAFRHLPEACMGSIGMILVSKEKPITYTVMGQGESSAQSTSSPSTLNSQLSTSSVSLLFDHTVFREPSQGGGFGVGSPLIHAFRAVWVSGLSNSNAREGLDGNDFDRLRAIRLKSAINRFRPDHARVIQGAVRGLPNSDLAWEAFENSMLKDLHMEKR